MMPLLSGATVRKTYWLVVFARISAKESRLIGIEENRTKLFLETENAVSTP
jgi:hypothetical protein